MSSMREHDYEPVAGLPERLPAGEKVLWQGAPDWRALARRAFHVRKVAAYFALLLAWRGLVVFFDGEPFGNFVAASLWLIPMAAVAIGILALLAWLNARSTIYTITSRRLVMRYGVALPMTINLPFALVTDVQLKSYPEGTGDIAIKLGGEERVSYIHMWPHVRRWRFVNPEPMLRVVPGAVEPARVLTEALRDFDARERPVASPSASLPEQQPSNVVHLAAAG